MLENKHAFETYWHEVEGMEDIHDLMTTFAIEASDKLVENVSAGEEIVIASFMNGGMNSLIYTIAELRRRMFEGEIDEETFNRITQRIAIFETKTEADNGKKVKKAVYGPSFSDASKRYDTNWTTPDRVVMIDDIIETRTTVDVLDTVFPDVPKTLLVPVIKHKTHNNIEGTPHEVMYIKEVPNDWIDAGAGMNTGKYFLDLGQNGNENLIPLQRFAKTGYAHKETTVINSAGALHYDRLLEEQLAWTHLGTLENDLFRLDVHKNRAQTLLQLQRAEKIIQQIKNFSYDEALQILTAG